MNRPRIFISAVTGELRGARRRVAEILIRKGYEPVTQDIWGTEPGDLRPMLRRQIESCEGLIQIVGDAYGAEPPVPDDEFGRCSYTQYEFLLARRRGMKTWLLVAGANCTRDTALAHLDLPANPGHPDLAGHQQERRELQRRYRRRPEFENHLRHAAESDLALDLAVERLGDELAGLRKEFRAWQRTVLRLAAAIMLLTGFVLGAVVWVKSRQDAVVATQKEIVQGQKEIIAGPKITTAGIRRQILQGSERKRDRDLLEADRAEPGKRQKLREAALAAHQSRIARIDELALSFSEIEGRADATTIFREMTRILEHEGVDLALAYAAEQKGGILDRIQKRKESERQQTRTELQPLLSAARLQEAAGQPVAARAGYRQLLDLDPAWLDALDAYGWFLHDQSGHANHHGSLSNALADAKEAHALAVRVQATDPANPSFQRFLSVIQSQLADVLASLRQPGDAEAALGLYTQCNETLEALLKAKPGDTQAMRDVARSVQKLGDFIGRRGQPGDAELAMKHFTRSLELCEMVWKAKGGSADATRDVSLNLYRIGDLLVKSRKPTDAETALGHFRRGLEITSKLLKENPGSAEATRDVALFDARLWGVLSKRGQPGDMEAAFGHLVRWNEMSEALLRTNSTSVQAAQDVSISLHKLGDFFEKRGQAGDAEKALGYYARSLEINENLMKMNPGSALAARETSSSLNNMGDFLSKRGQSGDVEKSVGYYTRALEIAERLLKANPGSAPMSRDVMVCLNNVGDILVKRWQTGDAEAALAYYTRQLKISETLLGANPASSRAKRDMSVSLGNLGDLLVKRGQPGDVQKAVDYFTRSLEQHEAVLQDNPTSGEAKGDVAITLNRLGDVLARSGQAGDAEKALECCTRGLALREGLLNSNPDSTEAAREVADSCARLGRLAESTGKADAAQWWRRAYGILARMKEKGQFMPQEALGILEEARGKLGQ